jgi:Tol biopolymer transport system component
MRKLISFAFALAGLSATAFPADREIAFERNNAVYVANLDGTSEKKIADGIFPAISPDGTRLAFNTVEKNERNDLRASHGSGRRRDWKGERL